MPDVPMAEVGLVDFSGTVGRRTLRAAVLGVGGMATLIGLWEAFVVVGHVQPVVLPTPVGVVMTLGSLVRQPSFWNDVLVSVEEFGAGYLLGGVLGYVVGVLLGVSEWWSRTLGPVVQVFRFVIPFSWIPLVVLWFGIGLDGKALLVAYAVFFVVALSVEDAVRSVDPVLVKVGRTVGMSRYVLLMKVRLRGSLPRALSGLRVAVAVGWITVVAAEYIGSSAGLGYLIINAQQVLSTNTILAGMVTIGAIGSLLSLSVGQIERRLTPHG